MHGMDTWPFPLRMGNGADPATGMCAMAAVNWLVHGSVGDRPVCSSPVVGAFVRTVNDLMDDDTRPGLLAFLHRVAGSASPAHERARAVVLVSGMVRRCLPAALACLDGKWFSGAAAELGSPAAGAAIPALRLALATAATSVGGSGAGSRPRSAALRLIGEAAVAVDSLASGTDERSAAMAAWAAGCQAAVAGNWDIGWRNALSVLDGTLLAGPEGAPWSATPACGIRGDREALARHLEPA